MRYWPAACKSGLTVATGLAGFYFWRGLERWLDPGRLYRLARAFYQCRAACNELFRRRKPLRDEPDWLRKDPSLRARIRRRARGYLNNVLTFFPDRLGEPKWRGRCRMEGGEHLRAAQAAGRPVVVAFFHFGPIHTMRPWARAYGFPAAIYMAAERGARGILLAHKNRYTPFPEVPVVFHPDRLRAAAEFLQAGNILFIAVDAPAGRHVPVAADADWALELNLGAARLAGSMGADLLLCSAFTEDHWYYRMKFSPPIPGETLRTPADWESANRTLLQTILPDFKAHPEQVSLPIPWKWTDRSASARRP